MFTGDNNGFFVPGNIGASSNDMQFKKPEENMNQKKKNRVFAPVTMMMIQEATPKPEDVCEIDGEPINDIIIVGRVIQRQEEPMRTLFEINDNSGTFKVIFYQKGENEIPIALKNFNYESNMYVKVYGTIRVFKDEKAIVGTHIKKIEKFDEVSNHLLQVFIAHCIRKKGVLTNKELQNQSQLNQMGPIGTIGGQNNRNAQGMMGQNNGMQEQAGYEELKKHVLEAMREISRNNKFVNRMDLHQQYNANNISPQQIDDILNSLAEDGAIYSTFNADSYSVV